MKKTGIMKSGMVCLSMILSMGGGMLAEAANGQQAAVGKIVNPAYPPPTLSNVAYGSDPSQVLDFWKAESPTPTPLVYYVHGGAWLRGKKTDFGKGIGAVRIGDFLAAGISVVSIEYRFIEVAQKAGIKPPVKWPLEDSARALQFVRSKAAEWNIDKKRIGATGSSAGACSSLWLAFHADMADPRSTDPVARESTRLSCAAVWVAQTTLDPKQMKEWTPNSVYGGHAFGFSSARTPAEFQKYLDGRESILPWIREYSPYEHVGADDPPVYLFYGDKPALGKPQKDPTHTVNFGVKLQERCRAVKAKAHLFYPGSPETNHKNVTECLIQVLKAM